MCRQVSLQPSQRRGYLRGSVRAWVAAIICFPSLLSRADPLKLIKVARHGSDLFYLEEPVGDTGWSKQFYVDEGGRQQEVILHWVKCVEDVLLKGFLMSPLSINGFIRVCQDTTDLLPLA